MNGDGSVSLNWDYVPDAKAFVIHYSEANESDPHNAKFMGYSESDSWSLTQADVPALQTGDKFYLYVQSFNKVGVGANDIEKAQYLNTTALGSAWSIPVVLEAK
ncbi:fibronectin type III domain-containing protein [Lactococcus garvieae]|uniref:fibronectin type III domain-containing protein n=1 Tax=Lactococcus garvieae TaxID=1363 RepID=UPI001CE270F1|nr:fibronectin type III domain-containing protein [Lactococcus garvieae]